MLRHRLPIDLHNAKTSGCERKPLQYISNPSAPKIIPCGGVSASKVRDARQGRAKPGYRRRDYHHVRSSLVRAEVILPQYAAMHVQTRISRTYQAAEVLFTVLKFCEYYHATKMLLKARLQGTCSRPVQSPSLSNCDFDPKAHVITV